MKKGLTIFLSTLPMLLVLAVTACGSAASA